MALRASLISLVDRRTVTCVLSVVLLFVLAFRGTEAKVAIETLGMIAVALAGSNAAQKALVAFAELRRAAPCEAERRVVTSTKGNNAPDKPTEGE